MRRFTLVGGATIAIAVAAFAALAPQTAQAKPSTDPEPGQLTIIGKDGKPGALCPLLGTKVDADIAGFGARVTVVQTFVNPTETPIEAVYTFPLPHDAAVDRMRIKVGSRVIEGQIRRREEARRIYEAAKSQGQTAALLDQERPNIFTQSVANIVPKARIQVEISYVQVLKYEDGEFEFSYPMVVGPRFLGNAPDPHKIAPPITPKGTRTGANIDLTVRLDAGAPIQAVQSVLHKVETRRQAPESVLVRLAKRDEIPNRDFILKYRLATDTVQSAFVTHYDGDKGGFFTLVLLPPKQPTQKQIAPREVFFVMDQSGSQSGFPIEKSKELTLKLIKTLRPDDTFNVFGFNNSVRALWKQPRRLSEEALSEAEAFVKAMQANGGTQLLEGLKSALEPKRDPRRLRLVVFNTDGFVGDEAQILDTIQKRRGDVRIFTFGIGNGVNRYLVESMSAEGKGACEIVTLANSADEAVDRFLRRTRTPVLTDIAARIDGADVSELMPSAIPDVFSETPIVVHGRYEQPGRGELVLSGRLGGEPWSRRLPVRLPAEAGNPSVPSLWARAKVDDLTRQDFLGRYAAKVESPAAQITDVALEFSIMSAYTSFVAVEPRVVNVGGKQRTVRVPVEMTDGVSYEGIGIGTAMPVPGMYAANARTAGFAGGGAGGAAATSFGLGAKGGSVAAKARLEESRRPMEADTSPEARYESVVASKLRKAKGTLAVMVWLANLEPNTLKALKDAGFKLDSSDKKLVLAFGTISAKDLRKLAALGAVQRVDPVD